MTARWQEAAIPGPIDTAGENALLLLLPRGPCCRVYSYINSIALTSACGKKRHASAEPRRTYQNVGSPIEAHSVVGFAPGRDVAERYALGTVRAEVECARLELELGFGQRVFVHRR